MKTSKIKFIIFIVLISFVTFSFSKKQEVLRKASFWEKLDKNYVKCTLCPFYCVLKPNQKGICKVRKNIKGELYTLVYNNPIEKKPLYHFLPGTKILSIATAGCNLNCNFCQNWEISQADPENVDSYNFSPKDIVNFAIENKCHSIAFTYTEPTIFYEYMLDIAKLAKLQNLKTVWVTCGYINPEPLKQLLPYLDAANIDLKGFNEGFYEKYTTGHLEPVLNTIKTAFQESLLIEITNLVIPNANDDPDDVKNMCNWIIQELSDDVPLHFSRFFPKYKLLDIPSTPKRILERNYKIALDCGLKYIYLGNVITDKEDTFCPVCGKKVIDRSGYQIIENNLINGKCKFCGEKIYGIYSP